MSKGKAFGFWFWALGLACSGQAETFVHPERADIGLSVLNVSVPRSDYTNGLIFQMHANAPDYNAGATNYFVPDLSTNRNDVTQTGTGYQPARIYTNGQWAFSFDGVDDKLITPITYTNFSQSIVIEAEFFYSSVPPYAAPCTLGTGAGSLGIYIDQSKVAAVVRGTSMVVAVSTPLSTGWHTAKMEWSGSVLSLWYDGSYVGLNTNTPGGPVDSGNFQIFNELSYGVAGYDAGMVRWVKIWK